MIFIFVSSRRWLLLQLGNGRFHRRCPNNFFLFLFIFFLFVLFLVVLDSLRCIPVGRVAREDAIYVRVCCDVRCVCVRARARVRSWPLAVARGVGGGGEG
jgi:hypothetical protein